jgi:hypothetical protein
MAWEQELTIIVRNLINDLSESPTYSDARIKQLLAVAAQYVQFDVVLDHEYVVNVVNSTISPDPTLDNDTIFMSLVCLKAACLVDQSTLRTKASMEGIRASLGSASLSVGGNLAGYKMILDHGPCALYDELTSHWDVSNASAIHAIFSPFVGNKFDAKNLHNSTLPRYRYDTFYS